MLFHFCRLSVNTRLTNKDAVQTCDNIGGQLPTFDSREQLQVNNRYQLPTFDSWEQLQVNNRYQLPTLDELETLAQSELTNLIRYFHINNLVPNPTKTNYSVFFPQRPIPLQLTIQSTTLIQNRNSPLLGITVEDTLRHTITIHTIKKKLWPFIHKLKYANKLLQTHILRDLYYTHAYPHLIGNISIWGTSDYKTAYIQTIIHIQKRIIRLITNTPQEHIHAHCSHA